MSINVSYYVRRASDSGAKLSTSTIIIIAVVAGSVVILVFALFAWRLLARYCRRNKTIPLPPKQDLAHHREQQLAAFTERNSVRPTTWLEPDSFKQHPRLYSSHFLSASGSSTSLIRSSIDYAASRNATRESSWAAEDATSTETSPYPTPSPLSPEDLMPPNPSFLPGVNLNPHHSMASVASSSSDVTSDVNATLPTSPSELTHSVESSSVSVHNSAYGSPVRPRPPRASRSRSRPMSMVSASTTVHSMHTSHSTSNVLRGPAHSIHSSVQIVLPTPLAPELYPGTHPLADGMPPSAGGFDRVGSFYGGGGSGSGGGDRKSVADPWVLAGSRPQSMAAAARHDKESSGASRMSSTGPRPSLSRPRSSLSKGASSSSLRDTDSASTRARRAQSQPPVPSPMPRAPSAPAVARARTPSPGPSHQSRPSFSAYGQQQPPLPPVPRIPSMYGNGRGSVDHGYFPPVAMSVPAPAPAPSPQEELRGRSWDPAPVPLPVVAPVPTRPAVDIPPSAYAQPRREPSAGKLRKNRASSQGRS